MRCLFYILFCIVLTYLKLRFLCYYVSDEIFLNFNFHNESLKNKEYIYLYVHVQTDSNENYACFYSNNFKNKIMLFAINN